MNFSIFCDKSLRWSCKCVKSFCFRVLRVSGSYDPFTFAKGAQIRIEGDTVNALRFLGGILRSTF